MRMLAVNSDLMIRTLCLLFAFTFFTAQAARAGDIILAANAVPMLFLDMPAFLLDGFALATEVLTGRAIGAGDRARFHAAIRLSTGWAVAVSAVVSAALALAGGPIIDALTANPEVRALARIYLPWVIAAPLAGVACFRAERGALSPSHCGGCPCAAPGPAKIRDRRPAPLVHAFCICKALTSPLALSRAASAEMKK
jgi:MATE family multidrug resistance protein